eukprot:gnl/TRDRNA2_/TRDRNA2_192205_c0_seq1.p2 gnl/TRDRNA2_/TRDRNA2_192205_c0~~gnl/TRDRNA2_/TRDRNA2_192205_c0_seq1.p2  ORF type:complete len:367 (-),score=91.00 gnl/TRDRNA2_/TRDRNA2_192205_c0_seq1:128-1228(-)
MDILSNTQIVAGSQDEATMLSAQSAMETLVCIGVAALMMHVELQRRAGNAAAGMGAANRRSSLSAESCKQLLRTCAPEAIGLIACLGLATAMRIHNDEGRPIDDQTWEQIKNQWPLLVTADTLLSVQAMLRLVVLLSATFRSMSTQPIAGWPAAFSFAAMVARVGLIMRSSVYMLDGPVGGKLPAMCEVFALPLLWMLGRRAIAKAPLRFTGVVVVGMHIAMHNHLSLSKDAIADSLFAFAHVLELLAAVSFLFKTVLNGSGLGVPTAFAHVLMPIQQAMAAYYFVEAFEAVPSLIGAGCPFEILQIGGATQAGAYLAALVIYAAECADGPEQPELAQEPQQPQMTQQSQQPQHVQQMQVQQPMIF